MTEMITIIAVGVGLAGLILNGQKNIREDMKSLDARFEKLGNANGYDGASTGEIGRIA